VRCKKVWSTLADAVLRVESRLIRNVAACRRLGKTEMMTAD
jgi:hypothetical protein